MRIAIRREALRPLALGCGLLLASSALVAAGCASRGAGVAEPEAAAAGQPAEGDTAAAPAPADEEQWREVSSAEREERQAASAAVLWLVVSLISLGAGVAALLLF